MKKWVLLSLILAISVLLIVSGCKKEQPAPSVTPPAQEQAPAPVQETPVEQPTTPPLNQESTPEVQYIDKGIISDVKCVANTKTVTFVITNAYLDTTQTVIPNSPKSNAKISVNGVNILDFNCDKSELAAKESTSCTVTEGSLKFLQTTKSNTVTAYFDMQNQNRGKASVICT